MMMRFRPRRCLLLSMLSLIVLIFWHLSIRHEDDAERTALSALEPEHFIEDSRRGILYHHKTHEGIVSYKTANDSWVRVLLQRFYNEQWSANAADGVVSWSASHRWARDRQLHPLIHPNIVRLLKRMASASVVRAETYPKGTQLKLLLTLDGGQRAVFKPKRYDTDFVLMGTPYVGKDRHFAEIAGFYLSRLLLFARTTLVSGRRFHFAREILPAMTAQMNSTIFMKDGRHCFYGVCHYCTGPEYGVCADEDGYLEGALLLHLEDNAKLFRYPHPWRRTYREGVQAEWETDGRRYCSRLLEEQPQLKGSVRLFDLMDASVHDFLIGNADRHHFETLGGDAQAVVVLMDNGKGFGNPYLDETSILAPLRQCCKLRRSTWKRLQELKDGVLSAAMSRLMAADPLHPVLTELHLQAMDRRLRFVITSVHHCIERNGHSNVLFDDQPL